MRGPVALHSYQHLILSAFFITAILLGTCWSLITVLTCLALMAKDVSDLSFTHRHPCVLFGEVVASFSSDAELCKPRVRARKLTLRVGIKII